jgi:hypothetical protein
VSVRFDDPSLVSCVGLGAVLALAARCGLAVLVTERVRIAVKGGANAAAKIVALVAGMVAGALASTFHARARTGTIRTHDVHVTAQELGPSGSAPPPG